MLDLINVSKSFEKRLVLNDVTFHLDKQQFVALMGPSGAGKSTLLNIIAGFVSPDQGTVMVSGKNFAKLQEPMLTSFRRKTIGYVFQDYNLIDYLTVWENVVLPLKLMRSKYDDIQIQNILTEVGLEKFAKFLPSKLSGGQKQRVAIARVLANPCPLVLADEPTGALDLNSAQQILELLQNTMTEFKKTLVMVTHDPKAAAFASEIIYLVDGKISLRSKNNSPAAIATQLVKLEEK